MARLKVFTAPMGFFDTIIAAPSQRAALEAWGTRQNLFHDGTARISEDSAAIAAALARPGVLLRRPAGSKTPFEEKAAPASSTPAPPRKAAPREKRPVPDRRALNEAETALDTLDAIHERERRDLAEKAAALQRRIADLDRDHRRARVRLRRALDTARRDYARSAGR